MNLRYNNITDVKDVSPIIEEVILLYDLVKPLKPTTRETREEVSLLLCLSTCYNTRPRINRVAHPFICAIKGHVPCRWMPRGTWDGISRPVVAISTLSADTCSRESLAAVRVTALVQLCIITVGDGYVSAPVNCWTVGSSLDLAITLR